MPAIVECMFVWIRMSSVCLNKRARVISWKTLNPLCFSSLLFGCFWSAALCNCFWTSPMHTGIAWYGMVRYSSSFFRASHTAGDDLPRFCLQCSFPPVHLLLHELAASWQQNTRKQASNKTNKQTYLLLWQTLNCDCKWLFYVNILGWLEVQKQTAGETVYVSQTTASSLLALTVVWVFFHRFHWSIFSAREVWLRPN